MVSQELGASINDGAGTFGEFEVFVSTADESYDDLFVADGDGDEVDDLLLANNRGYRWAFRDANSDEPAYSLGPIVTFPSTEETTISDLALGEANGDLLADLVVALPCFPTMPLTYTGNAAQTDVEPEPIDVPHVGLGVPLHAIVADIDGDEIADIVFTSNEREEVRWCRQLETGGFAEPITIGPAVSNSTRHGLEAHDFNLDGRVDILHQSGTQEAFIYQNDGEDGFTVVPVGSFASLDGADEPLYGFTAGDVSGDGRVDLIASGQSGVGAYFNTSAGGFLRFSARVRISSTADRVARLSTLHYDGINPVFIGSGSGEVLTYAFTGAAFVERIAAVPQATGFLQTASTDDGLGLPHLVYPSAQGFGIFERARNSQLTGLVQVPSMEEPSIADVDNDQDRDLIGIQPPSAVIVRRSADGALYSQNTSVDLDVTTDLHRVSVGDVNGDGLNDLVICAVDRIIWMQGLTPEARVNANDNLFPDTWEATLSEADAELSETELLQLYGFDRSIPAIVRSQTNSFTEVTFPRRVNDHRLRYAIETSNDLLEWTSDWESHQLADRESTAIGGTDGEFQTTTARWRSFEPRSFARIRVSFAE